ncbi:unnamed protein product [Rhizophagus irregularis]|nr:unnamed protein product [Rhizophagus irregularis]
MFSVNGFLFYYELSKESQPLLSVGQNWELRAWRKMMKSVGCTNLTPYKKQKSKPEFWTCAVNSSSDSTTLPYLFSKNLLNGAYNNEVEFIKENNQRSDQKKYKKNCNANQF